MGTARMGMGTDMGKGMGARAWTHLGRVVERPCIVRVFSVSIG